MIDRPLLEATISKHAQEMCDGAVIVELHLFNGEVFSVVHVLEYSDHHFVALVYPREPLPPEHVEELIPRNDAGRLVHDRAILPYSAVSYVLITAREPQRQAKLGFNP